MQSFPCQSKSPEWQVALRAHISCIRHAIILLNSVALTYSADTACCKYKSKPITTKAATRDESWPVQLKLNYACTLLNTICWFHYQTILYNFWDLVFPLTTLWRMWHSVVGKQKATNVIRLKRFARVPGCQPLLWYSFDLECWLNVSLSQFSSS